MRNLIPRISSVFLAAILAGCVQTTSSDQPDALVLDNILSLIETYCAESLPGAADQQLDQCFHEQAMQVTAHLNFTGNVGDNHYFAFDGTDETTHYGLDTWASYGPVDD